MSEVDFGYGQTVSDDQKKGPPKPTPARFALAGNLRELMDLYNKGFGTGVSATEVQKGSGVHAKTVRRILDPYNAISPNLETIDALAAFFRVDSWEMIQPRPAAISGREKQTPHKSADSSRAVSSSAKTHTKAKILKT